MARIRGTSAADKLYGTDGADSFTGGGGADIMYGGNGNDYFTGGDGADTLYGDGGIDTASYADSRSGVVVELRLGASGGWGSGGTAEGDHLYGIENVIGSNYADNLYGHDGDNVLTGGGGNDYLAGFGGDDTLWGDDGDDLLMGGLGADVLNGGLGNDTADYWFSAAGIFISLYTDVASGGDAEGDQLDSIENVAGSNHDDSIWGNDGANILRGQDGKDTLKGFGGADILYGGDDDDSLFGMNGADQLYGGYGHDMLSGGEGADLLVGLFGDDTLDGGNGADSMNGGAGNDLYFVDNAGDVITETGAGTIDTVVTTTSYVLTAGADVEFLQTTSVNGTDNINLAGNEISQQVTGNNGANTLSGGLGNDTLVGYGGADWFLFNSALDGATNVDVIFDFNQSDDLIALDKSIFSALGTGVGSYLTANEFTIGAAAADADDRIIYNSETGALLYDADGVGGADAIQFATIATGLTMVNDDFTVV